MNGGRVESQSDYNAVITFGKKPNHLLHLILTLVTCFLWGIVWIVVAIVVKESREMLAVDELGNVLVAE